MTRIETREMGLGGGACGVAMVDGQGRWLMSGNRAGVCDGGLVGWRGVSLISFSHQAIC